MANGWVRRLAFAALKVCPATVVLLAMPVSVALVEQMAREHSRLLFLQQQIFSNHLAEANRLGEVGRKDEMKRIFNIDI